MKIAAVVVLYYPDSLLVKKLIESIQSSVSIIVLVDNTPEPGISAGSKISGNKVDTEIVTVLNRKNLGVAAAHNQGFMIAKRQGCDYLLILDQDSCPTLNLISEQLSSLASIDADKRSRIAAVAPCFYDERYDYSGGFMVLDKLIPRKLQCNRSEEVHFVDYAISSGLLVNISLIDDIGLMNEDLFMDYVDIEWCLRARAKGYYILAVFSAQFSHELGDSIRTYLWGKVKVPLRSPVRTYYMVRNATILYKMKHIPLKWKIYDFMRLNLRVFVYFVINTSRIKHIKAAFSAIYDGLKYKPVVDNSEID